MAADIPALLRNGALGLLGGELDFAPTCLHLGELSLGIPLKANAPGHFVLSAISFDFGNARLASRGTTQSAPRFTRDDEVLRPKIRNGGV